MIIAAVPYLALQVDRGVRAALRGFGGTWIVVLLLLVAATVQVTLEGARVQPTIESVDGLRDGVSSLSTWVRMRGRIVTLSPPESVAAGNRVQSLLVEPSGDGLLLLSPGPIDHLDEVTGRIANSARAGETARALGGERFPAGDIDVVDHYLLTVDDRIVPPRDRDWSLVWASVLAAGLLVGGRWVGYPVVRVRPVDGSDVPAGARPLAVDEAIGVRVVERQEETGARLRAPRAELRRLARATESDPYFSLDVDGLPRPLHFRRHTWSTTESGTLRMLLARAPVVQLRDWGIEVLLALNGEADRDRLLASFTRDTDAGAGGAD